MYTNKILLLNRKILIGIAVGIFVSVVGVVAFSGQTILSDVSEGGIFSNLNIPAEVLPLEIELEDLSILEITDTAAFLKIKFKVSNPNFNSVILTYLKYDLYEKDLKVSSGQIGDSFAGFVIGSNYFTILNESPTILSQKITIKNTGNTPEFWSALSNSPEWKIKGQVFFNLSSMTSGAENEISFEFSK